MLPATKGNQYQLKFWDDPVKGHGHARFIIGELVEIVLANVLKGIRYSTDSNCWYCPDISVKDTFIECKAVGKTKEAFIYGGRLEKDYKFAQSNKLIYGIWHHKADTKLAQTKEDLIALIFKETVCIYLVSFNEIYDLAKSRPVEKINSKYGYGDSGRPTYGTGYRLPLKLIEQLTHYKIEWEYGESLG